MPPTNAAPHLSRVIICGAALMAGCAGSGPAPIAPEGLLPVDLGTISTWRQPFVPTQSREYTIRPWRFRNERGSAAGRATVVMLPPDSLRFDYRGPFRQSGRAAVVGDSALWVEPEEELGSLVSVAPLFWTAMGIPPAPPQGVPILAVQRPNLRAWQYVVDGDTLTFVIRETPVRRITGEIRRAGYTVTLAEATLDPETGFAQEARIEYPRDVSRFEFTVESVALDVEVDRSIFTDGNR